MSAQYDWDNINDNNMTMNAGEQIVRLYYAYEAVNKNGKPFLAIKGCATNTDIKTGDDGKPVAVPHAMIQVYYESDFGKNVLKNLIKASFGENRLKELNNNELICHAITKETPMVKAMVVIDGNYNKFKEFEFKPVIDVGITKPQYNDDLPF